MRSTDMAQDVEDFHTQIINYPIPITPTLTAPQSVLERIDFMREEVLETYQANMNKDLVEVVDGFLDMAYVALGSLITMGLTATDIRVLWGFVQEANMAKVRGETKRGNVYDAAKPAGWVPPNGKIRDYLTALGATVGPQDDAGHSASPEPTGDVS